MSALAEALVAAQARAIAAIGKGYIAAPDVNEDEAVLATLDAIGCGDKIEQAQLLAAWRVLRAAGVQPPPEQKQTYSERREDKPATDAQIGGIKKRMQERHLQPLTDDQYRQLTRPQASSIIESLDAGTFDRESVPF